MKDFDYEVMQKKRIAHSAWHRKGTKSRKCTLPTDKMTKKQWLERCGEVLTTNFNQPMTWENFKKLSNSSKEAYVDNLIAKFGVNKPAFARMFHRDTSLINRVFKELGYDSKWHGCARMTAKQSEEFAAWLNGGQATEIKTLDESHDVEVDERAAAPNSEPTKSVCFQKFEMTFCGALNVDEVVAQIMQIIPSGIPAKLVVSYSAEQQG